MGIIFLIQLLFCLKECLLFIATFKTLFYHQLLDYYVQIKSCYDDFIRLLPHRQSFKTPFHLE